MWGKLKPLVSRAAHWSRCEMKQRSHPVASVLLDPISAPYLAFFMLCPLIFPTSHPQPSVSCDKDTHISREIRSSIACRSSMPEAGASGALDIASRGATNGISHSCDERCYVDSVHSTKVVALRCATQSGRARSMILQLAVQTCCTQTNVTLPNQRPTAADTF